jgi:DNA-binding winged helix-turn-helix (wHTH) protein
MKTGTDPERAGSLVIELAARTAIVDGVRIELPPTEFALLAVLAARPGEIVSHKELAAAAFGEAAPVMAPHELHNRIYRLRKLLDDVEREHKMIENRRGQGYVLDMPPTAVEVLEGVSPTAGRDYVVRLDPPDDDPEAHVVAHSSDIPIGRPRLRLSVVGIASLVALAALGGSWAAGYAISRSRHEAPPSAAIPQPDHQVDDQNVGQKTQRPGRRQANDKKRPKQKGKAPRSQDSPNFAVGPSGTVGSGDLPSVNEPAAPSGGPQNSQPKPDGAPKQEPPPPPPPPQPNAQLYHLHNQETGDHIMTTSSSVANQKQAAGYDAGLEGGVFTSQEKGTVSISLDSGTAYVYSDASSAPSGVSVTALYKLSSGGDFFYTASASAANQAQAQGWARSTAGYVAS